MWPGRDRPHEPVSTVWWTHHDFRLVTFKRCIPATARMKAFTFGGSLVKITSKVAAVGASTALIVGLTAGSAAALDTNYAPGLPAPVAGEPNNPPTAAPVAQNVVTVSAAVAQATKPSVMKKEPTDRMKGAPKVKVKRNRPVKLVTDGLTPGATYVVSIKPVGGEYGTLGSVVGGADGSVLPAFRVDKKGEYVVAVTNVQTGETMYIKVKA